MSKVQETALDVLKSSTVFIVDDEKFMRNLVGRVLEDLGVGKIQMFENGYDLLKRLSISNIPVDLILLDLQMPNMNGFEVLKQIRNASDIHCKDVPVIILSGHSAPDYLKRTAALGIHGYLVKPVSGAKLKDAVLKARKNAPIDPSIFD